MTREESTFTFGRKFRGIRIFGLMPGANRKQVRDHIRAHQLKGRYIARLKTGTYKETRPAPPAKSTSA